MSKEFIEPSEMPDERLLYWAEFMAERFRMAQASLISAQSQQERFLAELMKRGLLDDLMDRMENG